MSAHPSYFELDDAVIGQAKAETESHIESCAECNAYVQRLRAPTPAPTWLSRAGSRQRAWRWRPLLVPSLLAATATAVVLLVVQPSAPLDGGDMKKGAPAVALHLKRGDNVGLWDGRTPLQTGDVVRLEVATAGRAFVTVVNIGAGEPTSLYAGAMGGRERAVLPAAWTLDEAPGPERLVVLLSDGPIPLDALARAAEGRVPGVAIVPLSLPKGRAP